MASVDELQLGKREVKDDHRTLMASDYMGEVSPPPEHVDWLSVVPAWEMYANNRLGDCTVATVGHMLVQWIAAGTYQHLDLTDEQIIEAYSAITGYKPSDPASDQGAYVLDVLNYWRKVGVAGHTTYAYVKLDPTNHAQVKQAINLFGAVYVGASLPKAAQKQVGKLWTVTKGAGSSPGSWGGHAIHVGRYDNEGLTCVTWGNTQAMTWEWWDKYVDEAYAVLSPDFFEQGRSPQGFDVATLQADLAAVAANQPTPKPTPTPPAPPTPTPPAPTPPTPVEEVVVHITDPRIIAGIHRAINRIDSKETPEQWVLRRLPGLIQ